MNEKMKKKLLMLIAILFIILSLLVLLNLRQQKKEYVRYTKRDLEILNESAKEYFSNKITPKALSKLYSKYQGPYDMNDLYESLYTFINYLPTLSDYFVKEDNSDIIEYYKDNQDEIENKTGITSEEDFSNFINYLKEIKYNGEKYVESRIQPETFDNTDNGYFTFDLDVEFENFDNDFKIKVYFSNYEDIEPEVYYTVVED